ncbi:MAG: DUF5320 domain-containing protein [Gammaproteobacteria bacterium]|nr:DUF5320 domain-containing protein [Gammaproteobacteria bacterium]
MPRGDRTGPTGMGARTGRGAGYCAGLETAGYENLAGGRGNFGGGRRRGRRFYGINQQAFRRGNFIGLRSTKSD